MISIVVKVFHSVSSFSKRRRKIIASCLLLVIIISIFVMATCYFLINPHKKYITTTTEAKPVNVGILFGAGITKEGKPYDELKARLDIAAQAMDEGKVNKLILSGDNRYHNYNEPDAMKEYLVKTKHIAAEKLHPDYAGRSTYESCERANKIFGVKETIVFSAESHLPRAIYLCKHFGVEAQGISSGLEANNSTRRELLARVKAVTNAIFLGERTVLGEPININ